MKCKGDKITIYLVEDHTIVREGLKALLESRGDMKVVGQSGDGEKAIREIVETRPDIVIMDLFLKGPNGLEAIEIIKRKVEETKILVLTMYDDESYISSALRAGASGYLLKGSGISEIIDGIIRIVNEGTYFSQPVARKIAALACGSKEHHTGLADRKTSKLTPREKQVLRLIAEGKTSSQIAQLLCISVKTVETHRTNIMEKLEIHNTAGLVRLAIKDGIILPE